jgi:hypothetical protein
MIQLSDLPCLFIVSILNTILKSNKLDPMLKCYVYGTPHLHHCYSKLERHYTIYLTKFVNELTLVLFSRCILNRLCCYFLASRKLAQKKSVDRNITITQNI